MLGWRKTTGNFYFLPPLRHISYGTGTTTTVVVRYSFKWQYMAEAGAGAGAKIRDKGGARKNNFGAAILI